MNKYSGSEAKLEETSDPITLWRLGVRKVLREMCFQTPVEQLHARLQQEMRSLQGPPHLLSR